MIRKVYVIFIQINTVKHIKNFVEVCYIYTLIMYKNKNFFFFENVVFWYIFFPLENLWLVIVISINYLQIILFSVQKKNHFKLEFFLTTCHNFLYRLTKFLQAYTQDINIFYRFINARRRILQPMLDASHSNDQSKDSKSSNKLTSKKAARNRSNNLDKFWNQQVHKTIFKKNINQPLGYC